jgi:hypothetical protein
MVTKMKQLKESREERLAKIRQKLANTDIGGGGAGFWNPPEGKSVIRILPPVKDMEWFFQEVGTHQMSADRKKFVYCPRFTSDGELDCPVCEIVHELYQAGGSANEKLAKQMKLSRKYWMNVIVRGKTKDDDDRGPFIFTPGVRIFETLMTHITDPDYGEIYDQDLGMDLTIERTGSGVDTRYQVIVKPRQTPISKNDDEVAGLLEKARDLSYVVVSDDPEEDKTIANGHAVFVLPYDRIVREFNLDDDFVTPDEEEEDEDFEEDIVEDDEDDDDEEYRDDEPVQPTPTIVKAPSPARAAVEERRAARRRRQG